MTAALVALAVGLIVVAVASVPALIVVVCLELEEADE